MKVRETCVSNALDEQGTDDMEYTLLGHNTVQKSSIPQARREDNERKFWALDPASRSCIRTWLAVLKAK